MMMLVGASLPASVSFCELLLATVSSLQTQTCWTHPPVWVPLTPGVGLCPGSVLPWSGGLGRHVYSVMNAICRFEFNPNPTLRVSRPFWNPTMAFEISDIQMEEVMKGHYSAAYTETFPWKEGLLPKKETPRPHLTQEHRPVSLLGMVLWSSGLCGAGHRGTIMSSGDLRGGRLSAREDMLFSGATWGHLEERVGRGWEGEVQDRSREDVGET